MRPKVACLHARSCDLELMDDLQSAHYALKAGDAEGARSHLGKVLVQFPECLEAYVLLAKLDQACGRHQQAIVALQRATSIDPDRVDLWESLADMFALRGNWREAAVAYEQAAAIGDVPEHLAALAMAQLAGQRHEAAEVTSRNLSLRFPRATSAKLVEGHLNKTRGNLAQAAAAYEQALLLAPDCSAALFNLAEIRAPSLSDPLTHRLLDLSRSDDLDHGSLADIEFALAGIHDRSRHFERAFDHYRNANQHLQDALRSRGMVYNPEHAESAIAAEICRIGSSLLRHPIEPLPIALKPIFIVGMPRSGTSLVEQILGSHPQVAAGGELTAAHSSYAEYLLERDRHGIRGDVGTSEELEVRLLRRARERYVDYLFEVGLDAAVVTDKFPGNFTILGFIRGMFPDAVIVHVKREPVATCWSLYTANLSAHAPYKTSFEGLGHYYRLYQRTMAHWQGLAGGQIVEVNYECLVSNPESQIRLLLEACDLPWDERCLNSHDSRRAVTTASLLQVRQPISRSSIERWLPYAPHLGPLRKSLDLEQVVAF